MISRNDCILLLSQLEAEGLSVKAQLKELLTNKSPSLSIIKFINDHRQFEANSFYEHIRKSYNNGRSKLYINIVKDDLTDPTDILTTLAALNLQILLFAKKLENSQMFLRHMRFEEINEALLKYSKSYDLVPCLQVLHVIKADLKAFESFSDDQNNS